MFPIPPRHFQPEDVFGPSEVIDHAAYPWRATDWRGRPWEEAVIIESHVGTFTQDGSYRAMIEKLDHLVQTGITALELMPLADFAGTRNWGYDGVLWYAPDSAYGRPEDLKALIDEAHLRGLMVFLDVVYNHFGPEGNYLGRYAPGFFTDAHTPWGSAIDYRVPQVRAFAIENALYWLREYRFDGLRLDAVNSIVEPGGLSCSAISARRPADLPQKPAATSIWCWKTATTARAYSTPHQDPPRGKYRAQWNDDYHHAWRVLMTGENQGYYGDYQRSPLDDIARIAGLRLCLSGRTIGISRRRRAANRAASCRRSAFINFLQNHDQIGNRAARRPARSNATPRRSRPRSPFCCWRLPSRCCSWVRNGARGRPFRSFAILRAIWDAVRKGRRSEYAWAYAEFGDEVPDALVESTFQSARLDWNERGEPPAKRRLTLVRELLAIRQREIVPRLAGAAFGEAKATDGGLLTAHWRMGDGATLFAARQSVGPRHLPCVRWQPGNPPLG